MHRKKHHSRAESFSKVNGFKFTVCIFQFKNQLILNEFLLNWSEHFLSFGINKNHIIAKFFPLSSKPCGDEKLLFIKQGGMHQHAVLLKGKHRPVSDSGICLFQKLFQNTVSLHIVCTG